MSNQQYPPQGAGFGGAFPQQQQQGAGFGGAYPQQQYQGGGFGGAYVPPDQQAAYSVPPSGTAGYGYPPDQEMGGGMYDKDSLADAEAEIRLGFIKKVYSIITFQLLLTSLMVYFIVTQPEITKFVRFNIPLVAFALVSTVVVSYILMCYQQVARSVPLNFILLALFTVGEAYIVGFICTFYPQDIILLAVLCTAGVTFALTLYACTTKTDFTMCGGMIFVLVFALFAASMIGVFAKGNPTFKLVICVITIIVYSFYLIYDTQLIIGGNHTYSLSIDDYILGALLIYIDIIMLFLKILELLGRR